MAAGFELHACDACGLRFVYPPTPDDALAAYYDGAFYGELGGGSSLALRLFHALRARVVERAHPPPGLLLDVGCGDGGFLAYMAARGWRVRGVESAAEGRARAGRALGDAAAVTAGLDGAPRGADVITLWHVLEHVADPVGFLGAVRERLAPDGDLVLAVPNHGSAEARAFGTSWFHLDVPRHQLHFTRAALTSLLARAGFSVASEGGFSLEYDPFGTLQSALNALGLEHNALYRFLKRGVPLRDLSWRGRAAVLGTFAAAPSLGTAVVGLDVALGLLGRGPTLTVVARRVG